MVNCLPLTVYLLHHNNARYSLSYLIINIWNLQDQLETTTAQMEQTATAKNEIEAALQRLQEEHEHLKQEHQKTLAKKVGELNNVKV